MGDIIDREIEIEQARWQERLEKVYCEYYPEVDGAGCDSGDPLDFTATEVDLTCIHLQEQIDALRAENQMLREAAQEALHYLECHVDVDAQLFCTKQLRAALAENPIAHKQGDK